MRWLWFAIFVTWASAFTAQEFEIKTFTSLDGLPIDYCFQSYQDPLGYLWIGTAAGLSRFDGGTFTKYGYAEGLPDFRVDALFMDHHKRLWIGTRRGIAELIGSQCISYAISDSLDITFIFGFIETAKQEILALTNVGIYMLDDSVWIKRSFFPGYDDHACRHIVQTEEGMYFNYGDVIVLRNNEGEYQIIAPYRDAQYYYVSMTAADAHIYIATLDGMFRLNGAELEKLPGPAGEMKGVYAYLIDSKNRCWIGTLESGLQLCELDAQSEFRTISNGPWVNFISQIQEDGDGTIWASCLRGLVRIREQPCRKYSLPDADSVTIHGIFHSEFTQAPTIYDGTSRLIYVDGDILNTQALYWHGNDQEFLISNQAYDEHGGIWCQLLSLDLVKLEGQTIYPQEETYAHLGDEVFDVIFDKYRKSVLISMITQDLPCVQGENQMFNKLTTTGLSGIPDAIVELHQCFDNTILVSTVTGGIYSIDTSNHCRMQLDLFHGKGLPAQFYNDMHQGVWIVFPERGMSRYIWQNDSLKLAESLTQKNGLNSDQVIDICFDRSGQLWVLTNKSISVFKFDEERSHYRKAKLFSAANLNLKAIGRNRMLLDTAGMIWIASDVEVLRFDPAMLTQLPTAVPSIQIESILVNHSNTDLINNADTLEGIFQLPKNLRLPHEQNTIDIQFQGIAVSGIEGIQYSYQLKPVDEGWSPPASGNSVSFVQLPPGEYTFNVRAHLTEDAWSDIASLSFEILQPFWETWWFMTAALFAVVFLMTTAFQYRLRSVQKKTELQDQLRNLESKALSAQMNPHFIHNALNSIQSLIVNSQSQMASQYVNKFARLLRHVMESGDKSLIPLEQELSALRLYIDLERLRMDMEFTYMEEVSEHVNARYIHIPPLLLQPFIENALWHGLSRKKGERILKLSITDDEEWILCRIMDNGIGREAAGIASGTFPMGSLSKAVFITRARLIAFNKRPDTEPLLTSDLHVNGQPAGTEVLVRIRKHLSSE